MALDAEAATVAGYSHPAYARALSPVGDPVGLPACGGWLLKRRLPGGSGFDAMGPYPLFCCPHWDDLSTDLDGVDQDLVSITLVPSPFCPLSEPELREVFRDHVASFKEHFVVDLTEPVETRVKGNHRRAAKRALRTVDVEVVSDPPRFAPEWERLYAQLARRHQIAGPAAFSPASLARQLEVPGLAMLRAAQGEKTVGAALWFVDGPVAYYHLAASDPAGYELGAAYALLWSAIDHFRRADVQWLALGAGAGVDGRQLSGLTLFKRGWATGTRPVYLCGRVLDHPRYAALRAACGPTVYFPAYRAGEPR